MAKFGGGLQSIDNNALDWLETAATVALAKWNEIRGQFIHWSARLNSVVFSLMLFKISVVISNNFVVKM